MGTLHGDTTWGHYMGTTCKHYMGTLHAKHYMQTTSICRFILLLEKIDFIYLFQFSFHLFFIEVQDSRCRLT
jgi:hypothetical protein